MENKLWKGLFNNMFMSLRFVPNDGRKELPKSDVKGKAIRVQV